jgi:hypothetical protein
LNSPILPYLEFYHYTLSYPPPIPGIVSIGLIFPFTYMCTQYLHYIHPHTLSPHFLPPIGSKYPTENCSTLCSLIFLKKKKWLSFKIATHGVSLWHFYVYMYYNPDCLIYSIFLLSTLVPSLWWFQQVKNFFFHSCIESTSAIFTFWPSFFYPPSLLCDLSLAWPVFHNIAVFVLGLYSTYERKHAAFGLLNLTNFT